MDINALVIPNLADFAIEIRSKCTNVLWWWIISVQMCKWNTTLHIYALVIPNMADFAIEITSKGTNVLR